MSSYSNFYNSYRYGNNSNEQNSGNNYGGNRQPVQPPQGYMEASYSWKNQDATSNLDNSKVYSNNNDVYSRPQDTSSNFNHLPAALGSYNQTARTTNENTQRPGDLNSLAYASSLESAYAKPTGVSQPTNTSAQNSTNSSQYQNTTNSYNYPPQSFAPTQIADFRTTANYNQQPHQPHQPQRTSSATSQQTAPSYTQPTSSVSHDATRNYHAQPTRVSQPERQPSPKVNPQAKAPRGGPNYKSPPTSHSSTTASLNAPSYSQTRTIYNAFAANTSSVVNNQHPETSRAPTVVGVSHTQTPPTMARNYPNAAPATNTDVTSTSGMEPKTSNQASPSKVQYINPTDLYTQQYFLAQERARAAEAEAVAKENRRNEETARAEPLAKATEGATATADAQATPTSEAKAKSTKPKPAKNTSKKRTSAKKKGANEDSAAAVAPEPDDDMASEMRSMLEKLRGMRTKDPSLFAQLWDDFKKAPPSTQAAPTPSVQASGQAAASLNQPPTGQAISAETVNPGDNTTNASLPDLGKFPAQRRRRNRKSENATAPPTSQTDAPATTTTTTTTTQMNVDSMLNQQVQPQPPPAAHGTQRATSAKTSTSTAAQTQQNASNATGKSQAKPSPGQSATWPAATQQKLAQAASEYLAKDPANKGKECSPDSLMLLLRNNPTYPDLCSRLESRGFALDRQGMARFLLQAVPTLLSGNNGQEPKKAEDTRHAPAPQVTQSLPLSATQPALSQPNGAMPPLSRPQPASSYNVTLNNPQTAELGVKTGVSTSQPLPEQKKEKNKFLARPRRSDGAFAPIPTVGPKAEKARKKLFSEIVDMTQLSSEEDDEDMLSDDENPYHGAAKNSPFGPAAGAQQGFPALDQDAMDLDTDSPNLTDHDISDSRAAKEAEAAQLDIEFDPDDEMVLESIKRMPYAAKPLNPSAALNRVYYNPKTIARDVLLATGRHPSDRPLNYHLMRLVQVFAGVSTKSDMEKFRWDLVDPGGPPMPVVELEDILVEPPQITRKRKRRHDESRDGADAKGPTSGLPPPPHDQSSVSTPQATRNPMAGTPTSTQRTGRRGRPPGAKNKKPTKAALKAAMAGATTTPAKSVRIAEPDATSTVPEPSYPVFTCEWASCPAQLHDVHTFERHVYKVHLPGQKTCQWHSCPNSTTEYSEEALKDHLAKAHIQPLAWKYGDGPSVNGTGFDLDRYLNANGLVVTPDTSAAGENDTLIFPVEHTAIRAFSKLYGDQKPAQQVLRAVRKRRRHVGIGLEQEGCEFSTPIRNKRFANDEDWYEVVADEADGVDSWFSQAGVS